MTELTTEQRIAAWANGRDDPLRFITECLGAVPLPWQREAIELLRTGTIRLAIRSAHDVGKTTLLAWVALWYLTTRMPCKIVLAANSSDQLRDIVHPEIVRWSRNLPSNVRDLYEFGLERVYLRSGPDEAFIALRTANKGTPEALAGFHSENLLFLIEEASGVEDIVFEIASGALSSKGSQVVMIGNPTRANGYFHKAFYENRWLWTGLAWPWMQTPYNDPGYPERMEREYGVQSNVYRVRVLGEFPINADNAVIPLDLIEAAISREVDVTARRSIVWGLDVARFGDDRCALVKRQGNSILERAKVWRHTDLMVTCGMVAREYHETREDKQPVVINIDGIGIGAGVVDRLLEIGLPVASVNVGETAEQPERFARRRDELWWMARDWFTARDCKIVDDPDLISDLVAPTYKPTSAGKVQIESKDELKRRGIKSPDLADAFCLTFAGGEFASRHRLAPKGDDGSYDHLHAMDAAIEQSWRRMPARAEE